MVFILYFVLYCALCCFGVINDDDDDTPGPPLKGEGMGKGREKGKGKGRGEKGGRGRKGRKNCAVVNVPLKILELLHSTAANSTLILGWPGPRVGLDTVASIRVENWGTKERGPGARPEGPKPEVRRACS